MTEQELDKLIGMTGIAVTDPAEEAFNRAMAELREVMAAIDKAREAIDREWRR